MTDRTGFFCVAGRPTYGGEFDDLPFVPDEIREVRAGLAALGLVDLFPADPAGDDGTAHSPEQLADALFDWSQEYDADADERTATLVVYVTGHGYAVENDWLLVPPETTGPFNPDKGTRPARFVSALRERRDLGQLLIVLDACGAASGGEQAFLDSVQRARFHSIDDQLDLWVVAAARRAEEAAGRAFSTPFVAALRATAASTLHRPHLDLAEVMEPVQQALAAKAQRARIVAGHSDPRCRALPNPLFMPTEAPTGLPPGWGAAARGVLDDAAPGWYFTGRDAALRSVLDHLSGAGAAPALWLTGSPGSGTTALLARVVTTATADLRAALPMVTRRGVLPADDLALAAVDAAGRTADDLAAEIAESLGYPADTAPGLLGALRRAPDARRGVVVDHLDLADDPAAVVADLVEPLSALPTVRVVVGTAGRAPAQGSQPVVDLDEPRHHGPETVGEYLRARLRYGGHTSPHAVDALERICGGCFAAAVSAVDVLLQERNGPLDKACDTAVDRLDGLLRRTLGTALPVGDAAADVVNALCSWHDGLHLDPPTWAAVVRRVTGTDVAHADLAAVLVRAGSLLVEGDVPGRTPGTTRRAWRPRYPARADDTGRRRIVRHLLDEIQPVGGDWGRVAPHLLDILAAAAADPAGGVGHLLDDPDFLLALPRATRTRTVKALRGPRQAAHAAVWIHQPRKGRPHQHRLALALAAARSGLDDLARAVGPVTASGTALEVLWARPGIRERHTTTRVGAAGEPGRCSVISGHDDGTTIWWDGATGEQQAEHEGTGRIHHLHAVAGPDGADALLVLADGSVHRRAPDADRIVREGTGDLPGPAAGHPAGFLALAVGTTVDLLSGADAEPVAGAAVGQPVVALAVVGPSDDPAVWIATLDGVIRRWTPFTADRPRRVALCPHPVRLAASADGDLAVIVDATRNCTFIGGAAPLARTIPTLDHTLRAVELTPDQLVVAGGDRDGAWLDTYGVADGRSARWPLDGRPVALASHGADGLIVATDRALALLRARDATSPTVPYAGAGRCR